MKRDTSEALPERVLALLEKHGGWQATLDYIAKLEAAAEPADAGRDAVAWLYEDGSGRQEVSLVRWHPATVKPAGVTETPLTRPQSEAAAGEDDPKYLALLAGVKKLEAEYRAPGKQAEMYCCVAAADLKELASQQAVKP